MAERTERTILKLSGELFGEDAEHISFNRYDLVAKQIIQIIEESDVQMAIVVGGGNIFRGREAATYVDHTEADSMGMIATVLNGLGLREALIRNGATDTRLMTAFGLNDFAEPYIKHKARHHLDMQRLIVIAGGLGKPNFSTDSAVAQYADELQCDIIFKASTVNGVYDCDPNKNDQAVKYDTITYKQALYQELGVMDATAFTLCMNSKIPIFVFDIKDLDRLPEIIQGDYSFGTLIKD